MAHRSSAVRSVSPFAERCARALRSAREGARGTGRGGLFLITHPMDVGYLTGFLGGDSYLILGGKRPAIISDFRYEEELEPLKPTVDVIIRRGSIIDAVAAVVNDLRGRALALQAEHVTLSTRGTLATRLKGVKLVETTGILLGLRAVKDENEVRHIRAAVKIQQAALLLTLDEVERRLRSKGSILESEIATTLEAAMRDGGSGKPAFESIVAAGVNGSLPHYRPGRVAYRRNRGLLIDWGATVKGYHSDMTRTVVFGRWPKKLAEIYEIVREAHELGRSAIRAGASTADVDRAARSHIEKHGYGERFGHGLGHGIGLVIHEEPRLTNMAAGTPLVAGNVVTVEPGIYLPGVGGVRLENDYLVTEKGATNLCSLPMDRDWATR